MLTFVEKATINPPNASKFPFVSFNFDWRPWVWLFANLIITNAVLEAVPVKCLL